MNGRSVPFTVASTCGIRGTRKSLDQLVGAGEPCRWNSEAQSLRCLQVDDEVEFPRLLEGKIGRIGSIQDPSHVTCGFAENVSKVHAVGHESSEFGHLSVRGYCYKAFVMHQVGDQLPFVEDECVAEDEKAVGSRIGDGTGYVIELLGGPVWALN